MWLAVENFLVSDPWGSQAPRTQLALRLLKLPKWRGPGPADCVPCRQPLPLGCRGGDRGEVHRCLKAWARPVGGLGEGSGTLQDTAPSLFPKSPGSPSGLWSHWALYSVPLIHISVFVPVRCCFDYCSFVVLSEVWEGYASCLFLFLQDCCGNPGSFMVPYKF